MNRCPDKHNKGGKHMKKQIKQAAAVLLAACLILAGCSTASSDEKKGDGKKDGEKPLIGVLFRTLAEEKWTKEKDMMIELAEKEGYEVVFQSANDDVSKQLSQCENLLAQGVDALIVLPVDDGSSEPIVEKAHAEDVPVISYDQIVLNADLDYNVTFDSTEVGKKMAAYAVEKAPKGKYVLLCGGQASNNATLIKNGWHEILDPYIKSGDIEVVYEQYCENWSPEIALQYAEDALTANNDDIQAILCANDNMANGAIQALTNKNLQGKVVVTGQDADLLGCQNIVNGYQSLTVYKPSSALSQASMEAAFALIKGEDVKTNSTMDNGYKEVPTVALDSFVVDKDNIDDTIIKDGYQSKEEVYGDKK
ncbi:D-xylose ABC transporter, periplasmic D-xylose-binding protein [Dorea sp. D27]|nr:D-xylose ABC transporter, periplasmic D-xylose-binding protein [Dorea sp. D27]